MLSRRTVLEIVVAILFLVIIVALVIKSGMMDPYRPPGDPAWGSFSGNPKTEWLPDGRKMKLLEQFTYTDPKSKSWVAPKDWVVDGASIPQAFWSLTGGPMEGPFRNASVCHDVECDRKTEQWREVHYMFYEAMRCGGVSEDRAKTMYAAVYLFGPRWEQEVKMQRVFKTTAKGEKEPEMVRVVVTVPTKGTDQPAEDVAEKLKRYIEENKPSLEDIQKLDPKDFGVKAGS